MKKLIYIILFIGFLASCSTTKTNQLKTGARTIQTAQSEINRTMNMSTTNQLKKGAEVVQTEISKKMDMSKKEQKHWSYEGETGPEHWKEIEKTAMCNGNKQSPINIIAKDAKVDASIKDLDIHYNEGTLIHDVINNGHSIQYDFEAGDYVNYAGSKYFLKQIHFHEASEHTLNGVRYPLEIHMVHLSEKKEFLVISVMVREDVDSAPFKFLETYLPLEKGTKKPVGKSFNLNKFFPETKEYFHYTGSLTTPPCTEGVSWFVFQQPITASLKQVKQLQSLMPINNYRNEQPLNDRVVSKSK